MPADVITTLWVYLAQSPLLWLTLTLVVYQAAHALYRRTGYVAIFNPVLLSVIVLVGILLLTRTPYNVYFDGAQFIHFLLGPATVALAIPLYGYAHKLKHMIMPLMISLVTGSLTAILSAISLAALFQLSTPTLLSLAPKSVTTPIAMGVTETIGGIPSLTAVFVILTGIIGATFAREILNIAGVRNESARGFAIGLSAHGIGTARAFQLSEEAGAFAGLAIGLNGATTAVLVPIIIRLLGY